MTASETVLDHALAYTARGWHVFPVVAGDKVPVGHLAPRGFKDATTDPATVRSWFASNPDLSIGIACGPSGLAVLDIDPRGDAQKRSAQELLIAALGGEPPPAARVVATGGGGLHVYFAGPTAGAKLCDWADLKGEGGYVVAPPSQHASGRLYAVVQEGADLLPPLPGRVTRERPSRAPGEWKSVLSEPIREGGRHDAMARFAGGQLQALRDPAQAAQVVHAVNATHCVPPLPEWEIQRIVDDLATKDAACAQRMMDDRPSERVVSSSTIISGVRTVGQLAPDGAEVDWLWHGYLATEALVVLGAKPKAGKSTLLFSLLAALENGQPFAGRPTRRARVLVVSEESEAQLRRKADAVGLSPDWHLMLPRSATWGADWRTIAQSAGEVAASHGCDAVVFDTFNGLARLRGDDENKAGAALEAVEPLHGLKAAGLGVLLVAHERKSEGDGVDTIRGANALTGDVDLIARLYRPSGGTDTQRRLEAFGRYDETPDKWDVEYDRSTATYSTTEAPVVAKRRAVRSDRLADLRALGRPATASDMAVVWSCDPRTAKRHLDALAREGCATQAGAGTKSDPSTYTARMMDDDDRPLKGGVVVHHPQGLLPADSRACAERGHQVLPHPATGKPTCATCHPWATSEAAA